MIKIIAVDFDGTLTDDEYPGTTIKKEAVGVLLRFQKRGGRLILWTCRADGPLRAAVNACAREGLFFNSINDHDPSSVKEWNEHGDSGFSKKVYADLYIDDKESHLFGEKLSWKRLDKFLEEDYTNSMALR